MTAWTERLTQVVSLASLAIGAVAAWYALPLDQEIKALQAETARLDNRLKLSDAELKKLAVSREMSLKLYQEVKQVLARAQPNPREEEAIRVLVDSLAEDPFRWKLLQALAVAASDPEVQQKAEATATFFREQGEVPVADPAAGPDLNSGSDSATGSGSPAGPTPATSGAAARRGARAYRAMKVDLFYCGEAGGRGAALAEAALALRGPAGVRWRVRALPEEINSRPGYDIRRHLLRFNRDERPAALALQADLKSLLKVDVAVMEIQYPTPNYLSVFFCG